MGMVNPIGVGVCGLGRSGWSIHAAAFESCPSMYRVVAVSDQIEQRRREAVAKFRCRAYGELDSLLRDEEVELVVVATPTHLHASQSIMALESGKHVVCEKPMATNLNEADAMMSAAKKYGKVLTIFQNKRYSPDFLKVKEVINSGKLGRVILIKMCLHSFGRRWDWQTLRKFGGGELANNASHLIDQSIQLLGGVEPDVLFCDLQRTLSLGDAEDHVKIILGSRGLPTVDIEVTHACAYPQNWWLIMGTQGGLAGNNVSLRWKYFNPEELPRREVIEEPIPDRSYNWEEIPWKEEAWLREEGCRPEAVAFYEDLYRTLREGSPLAVTPESVRKAMSVIEKCRERHSTRS